MRRFTAAVVAMAVLTAVSAHAQEVSTEYRVKAAFLYNFVKFVEWPPQAPPGPVVICVAARNTFGTVLTELLRGETITGRSLEARTILEPDPGCHVLFVPRGASASAYLRATRGTPELTVGEASDFIGDGGMIRFYLDGANVRFEINRDVAERAGLRISSRLLQLARLVTTAGEQR